jgi:chlorobactene glucosyltransferase
MLTPLMIYALLVLSVLVALLLIVLVNLAVLPSITLPGDQSIRNLRVAVLVPARNEEENIEACLRSLLRQDYPNLEVWVYDDISTDRTAEILARLETEYQSTLYVVRGTEAPPPGWLGKASACQRLYTAMQAQYSQAGTRPD